MKRNEVMALIATSILMFAVCVSASAKGKRKEQDVEASEHSTAGCSVL